MREAVNLYKQLGLVVVAARIQSALHQVYVARVGTVNHIALVVAVQTYLLPRGRVNAVGLGCAVRYAHGTSTRAVVEQHNFVILVTIGARLDAGGVLDIVPVANAIVRMLGNIHELARGFIHLAEGVVSNGTGLLVCGNTRLGRPLEVETEGRFIVNGRDVLEFVQLVLRLGSIAAECRIGVVAKDDILTGPGVNRIVIETAHYHVVTVTGVYPVLARTTLESGIFALAFKHRNVVPFVRHKESVAVEIHDDLAAIAHDGIVSGPRVNDIVRCSAKHDVRTVTRGNEILATEFIARRFENLTLFEYFELTAITCSNVICARNADIIASEAAHRNILAATDGDVVHTTDVIGGRLNDMQALTHGITVHGIFKVASVVLHRATIAKHHVHISRNREHIALCTTNHVTVRTAESNHVNIANIIGDRPDIRSVTTYAIGLLVKLATGILRNSRVNGFGFIINKLVTEPGCKFISLRKASVLNHTHVTEGNTTLTHIDIVSTLATEKHHVITRNIGIDTKNLVVAAFGVHDELAVTHVTITERETLNVDGII